MKQQLIKGFCFFFVVFTLAGNVFAQMTAEEKAYRDKIEFFDVAFDKKIHSTVVGEVMVNYKLRNTGNKEVHEVVTRVRYLDEAGEVVRTQSVWALDGLNNMRAPFLPGQIWQGVPDPSKNWLHIDRMSPKEAERIKDFKLEIMEVNLGYRSGHNFTNMALKPMTKEEQAYMRKEVHILDLVAKPSKQYESPSLKAFFRLQNAGNRKLRKAYLRFKLYDNQGNLIFVTDQSPLPISGIGPKTIWEYEDDLKPMIEFRTPYNWDNKTVEIELHHIHLFPK